MLNAIDTQFTLITLGNGKDATQEEKQGTVFYQENATNPLPGVAVAKLVKGQTVLSPAVEVLDNANTKDIPHDQLLARLQTWITNHIATTLETLVKLTDHKREDGTDLPAPVIAICDHLYNALGIAPRDDIAAHIQQLDADTRRDMRSKRIKLGPILVFLPDLNKPAAIRLRGFLWALHNDKPLYASTHDNANGCIIPPDGVVSLKVNPDQMDKDFARMIGYPVYGNRAIRIDMLDRVINLVYDTAKQGQFRAQHQMAEWLGCPIDDLYEILGAMGHKQVEGSDQRNVENATAKNDAPNKPESELAPEETAEAKTENEVKAEATVEADVKAETPATGTPIEKPAQQKKPDLALFWLKKGKAAIAKAQSAKQAKEDAYKKANAQKTKGKRNKTNNKPVKKMSAGPMTINPEDSPFAILQQLKNAK